MEITKLMKVLSSYVGTKPVGKYVVFQFQDGGLYTMTSDEESLMQVHLQAADMQQDEISTLVIEPSQLKELTSHMRHNSKCRIFEDTISVGKFSTKMTRMRDPISLMKETDGEKFEVDFKKLDESFSKVVAFTRPINDMYNVKLFKNAIRLYDIVATMDIQVPQLMDYEYTVAFKYRPFTHVMNALHVIQPDILTFTIVHQIHSKWYCIVNAYASDCGAKFILDCKVDRSADSKPEIIGTVDLSELKNVEQTSKLVFTIDDNLNVFTMDEKLITSKPIDKKLPKSSINWIISTYKLKFLDLNEVTIGIWSGAMVISDSEKQITVM